MAFLTYGVMALVCMGFLGVGSCRMAQRHGDNVDAKALTENSCQRDEDCQLVMQDCCGCRQGGAQIAISRLRAKEYLEEQKERCSTTMCPQVISSDQSCSKQAACIEGECVLE